MSKEWRLRSAEKTRLQLTKTQQRDIERMYKRISRNIKKQSAQLPSTTSGHLRKLYLDRLQEQINEQLTELGRSLHDIIKTNIGLVAAAAVADALDFNEAIGLVIQGAFSHVPKDIVQSVITGQVYAGNWSLSRAIWDQTSKTKHDINTVIAEGIAQNKSTYDIAKDLEKYVDPSARKDWSWSKVYPGTAKVVDYNAQRLARTMVSHAYQQSFIRTTQKNPFVTKYKWLSSNSGRVCELCASRDGSYFSKDNLPMDHPNGMCTYVAVMEESMVDMADRIADWVLGNPDPALDDYSEFLRNS